MGANFRYRPPIRYFESRFGCASYDPFPKNFRSVPASGRYAVILS